MRSMERTTRWGRLAGIAFGAMALGVTLACNGTPAVSGATAETLMSNHAGAPILVGCEPHQRTLVRQAIVNGAAVSQVECVAVAPPAPAIPVPAPVAAAPVTSLAPAVQMQAPAVYAPAPSPPPPPPVVQPAREPVVHDDLGDAQVVRTSSGAAGPVRTRQVVYDDPPPPTRSAAKSAVIIGSSAGAGAGVGAVVGGKKGALIGAAVGGGGAAVWDQVTRRK